MSNILPKKRFLAEWGPGDLSAVAGMSTTTRTGKRCFTMRKRRRSPTRCLSRSGCRVYGCRFSLDSHAAGEDRAVEAAEKNRRCHGVAQPHWG